MSTSCIPKVSSDDDFQVDLASKTREFGNQLNQLSQRSTWSVPAALARHSTLHLAQLHAAANLWEKVQEAHVEHARDFWIWGKCRSSHAAKELALNFATSCEWSQPDCTAAAAEARRSRLAANVTLQAQQSLLCCTSNVVELWDATIITAAASAMHDDFRLVNRVHLHLSWGRHVSRTLAVRISSGLHHIYQTFEPTKMWWTFTWSPSSKQSILKLSLLEASLELSRTLRIAQNHPKPFPFAKKNDPQNFNQDTNSGRLQSQSLTWLVLLLFEPSTREDIVYQLHARESYLCQCFASTCKYYASHRVLLSPLEKHHSPAVECPNLQKSMLKSNCLCADAFQWPCLFWLHWHGGVGNFILRNCIHITYTDDAWMILWCPPSELMKHFHFIFQRFPNGSKTSSWYPSKLRKLVKTAAKMSISSLRRPKEAIVFLAVQLRRRPLAAPKAPEPRKPHGAKKTHRAVWAFRAAFSQISRGKLQRKTLVGFLGSSED